MRLLSLGAFVIPAAYASAQISNSSAVIEYSNIQYINYTSPVLLADNDIQNDPPVTSLSSPSSTHVYAAPNGSGTIFTHSAITSFFSATSNTATLSGRAFAEARAFTDDGLDVFQGDASASSYMSLFVNGSGTATFSLSNMSAGGNYFSEVMFELDNTVYSGYTTDTTFTVPLSGGSHTLDVEFFARGYAGIFSPADASGNVSGDFNVTVNAVPEPASIAALSLGVVGLIKRRKKSQ